METLRQHCARYAQAVLAANNGNKRQTCRVLGITYHTLSGYLRINASQNANDALTASNEEAGGQWMRNVANEWAADLGDQRQDRYFLDDGQPMAREPFAGTPTSHGQSAGPLDDERS